MSKEDIVAKRAEQKEYIMNKINLIQKTREKEKEKENRYIITNLPKFESDFERMHENYYKT